MSENERDNDSQAPAATPAPAPVKPFVPLPKLDQKQIAHLKGLAHHLKPVVQVGNKGLTAAVIEQIEAQLAIHELIKIKLGQDAPVTREEVGEGAGKACRAHVVQHIGRNVVLYRPKPKPKEKAKAKPKPKPRAKAPKKPAAPSRTAAPKKATVSRSNAPANRTGSGSGGRSGASTSGGRTSASTSGGRTSASTSGGRTSASTSGGSRRGPVKATVPRPGPKKRG